MSRADRPRGGRWTAAVGVLGELLLTAGALVLLFVVWQLWWTDLTSDADQAQTVSGLERDFGGAGRPAPPGTAARPPRAHPALRDGQAFAIVRIPRFGSGYARPVFEGTGQGVLSRGIGHTPGSAQPGQVGNFATAGHRVTYGKPYNRIAEMRPGDAVVVETLQGFSIYRYARHRIVDPHAVEVIAPVPDQPGRAPTDAWMTLVACHPPYSARERYVGFARLERFVPRAAGTPTDALKPPA